jgi:hypothetical protein
VRSMACSSEYIPRNWLAVVAWVGVLLCPELAVARARKKFLNIAACMLQLPETRFQLCCVWCSRNARR